ncbi:MAG: hypothetical protein RL172_2258 [Bacteroidota bacterium]|jgi:two-component system, NarL family, sensor kinase
MNPTHPQIAFAIVVVTIVFLLLSSSVVVYGMVYQRRRKEHTHEVTTLKYVYEQELLQTQIEIQEQTMKNISQELHDNIGQMLGLAKLRLNTFPVVADHAVEKGVEELKQFIGKAIKDLRDISKSLHGEKISDIGLQDAIANELNILQNIGGRFTTNLHVDGEPYKMDAEKEIILFRIVQEALNNTVKHAQAKNIDVTLHYSTALFKLTVQDDGIGFDPQQVKASETGIGLKNMYNRARMIGGEVLIESGQNKEGTKLSILLKTVEESVQIN